MGRILDNNAYFIRSYFSPILPHSIDIKFRINPHSKSLPYHLLRNNLVPPSFPHHLLEQYHYVEERNRLVSGIESILSQPTTLSLDWQQLVTLQGARVPVAPDTLHFPSGTLFEPLRQGLLTFNTYVSALRLPVDQRPDPIPVWTEGTRENPGDRRFFVGEWVVALDTVHKWLEATVIAVSGSFVYIHYNGWPRQWDEWIHVV